MASGEGSSVTASESVKEQFPSTATATSTADESPVKLVTGLVELATRSSGDQVRVPLTEA
jgi:hypothetical protein